MFFPTFSVGEEGFYKIDNSLLFNSVDIAHLTWTPSFAPTSSQKMTFTCWCKRSNISTASGQYLLNSGPAGGEDLILQYPSGQIYIVLNASTSIIRTKNVFRDPSSHMHICIGFDTTQAIASSRIIIEINGILVTEFDISTYPSLNYNFLRFLKTAHTQFIGRLGNTSGIGPLDGYLSNVCVIDGQQLSASNFGYNDPITNQWRPKKYEGTYGTNGFHLDFKNNATTTTLGYDASGNGNNWALNSMATTDQTEDSPTNNFCTLNPLDRYSDVTLTEGSLKATFGAAYRMVRGTFKLPSSGKWYFEAYRTTLENAWIGIATSDYAWTGVNPRTSTETSIADTEETYVFVEGVQKNSYWTVNPGSNWIGVCYDADNNQISWQDAADGQGSTYALTEGKEWYPLIAGWSDTLVVNFGQTAFSLTPPTGFKALCTKNLPEPAIKDPSVAFDAISYLGNGAVRNITDANFQPGLVWIKNRNQADEHKLIDSVRGATKELSADSQNVEQTDANGLTAFLSNGFSLGTGANGYNDNAENFIAWLFKEGAQYGFDIITYTGNSVAGRNVNHNLGVAPELMMIKDLDWNYSWMVYHHKVASDPETDYLVLDTNAGLLDNILLWNDTAPTNSVFTLGSGGTTNNNGQDYIAYLFTGVDGFSKVFSYTGNGSIDGPFVYLGFKPRFILWKRVPTSGYSWEIQDAERSPYNPANKRLYPDLTNAEATQDILDMLSNGFKIRNTSTNSNANGILYVGIAFAEVPFKYANAR
ncbi:hypothetical protein KAR91_74480 [Candidatus Pacearchaeota archaeon]|nr:hypothetical protein [Candidatus Pacearchaeota archaeon]